MNNISLERCIDKIFSNIIRPDIKSGMVIASPSKLNPNYYYHWIRDSGIVMRTIVKYYIKTGNLQCFKQIIDYVESEKKIQGIQCITGLGEPKFNVNQTSFNDVWGRPQNDGPALRVIVMLDIYNNFPNYSSIRNTVKEIINKDIDYIIQNHNIPCYDLWEEVYGYHLYTRAVQCKALKECLKSNIFPIKKDRMEKSIMALKNLIQHHQYAYTSFNEKGEIVREFDTALLFAVTHIDFDREIIDYTSNAFKDHLLNMIDFYNNQFRLNVKMDILLLGRYKNDTYYGGNPWIICTCALLQILLKYEMENIEFPDVDIDISKYLEYFQNFHNFNLPEQIEKFSGEGISALNLTWNYAEIFNILYQ